MEVFFVSINGFVKSVLQFVNRCSMKADNGFYICYVANEDTVVLVEFNASGISPILHCVHRPTLSRSGCVASKAGNSVSILHY